MAETFVFMVFVDIIFVVNIRGLVNNYANGKTKEVINWTIPASITLGEVIVYRHNMDAAARKSVKVGREQGDQSFTFAGFHFGNVSFVERHAADKLNVKVAHAKHAVCGFANQRKGVWQNVV